MSFHLRVLLCVTLFARFARTQDSDGFTDEKRPYKFGFNIEGYQHRYEEKNEKGIIMGEYGFITGDGIYHLTVYATDENGNFKILRTKNVFIGLPGEKTSTPVPAEASVRPERVQEVTGKTTAAVIQGVAGCGGCVIPTTAAPQAQPVGNVEPVRGSTQGGSPLRPTAEEPGRPIPGNYQVGYVGGVGGTGGRPAPNQIAQRPTQTYRGGIHEEEQPGIGGGGREKDANQKLSPIPSVASQPGFNGVSNGSPLRPTSGEPGRPALGKYQAGDVGGTGGRPAQQEKQPGIRGGGREKDASQKLTPTPSVASQPGFNDVSNDLNDPRIKQMLAKVPKMTDKVMTAEDLQALFYMFNYTLSYHGHNEFGSRRRDKNGSYFFNDRDGFGRNVSYIANEFGYQPNITLYELTPEETPKVETEKNATKLLGNEFKWFYGKV